MDITFEEAIKEVEEIAHSLESNEIPVDQLEEKVRRAKDLLQFCRNRLRSVSDVVKETFTTNEGE